MNGPCPVRYMTPGGRTCLACKYTCLCIQPCMTENRILWYLHCFTGKKKYLFPFLCLCFGFYVNLPLSIQKEQKDQARHPQAAQLTAHCLLLPLLSQQPRSGSSKLQLSIFFWLQFHTILQQSFLQPRRPVLHISLRSSLAQVYILISYCFITKGQCLRRKLSSKALISSHYVNEEKAAKIRYKLPKFRIAFTLATSVVLFGTPFHSKYDSYFPAVLLHNLSLSSWKKVTYIMVIVQAFAFMQPLSPFDRSKFIFFLRKQKKIF